MKKFEEKKERMLKPKMKEIEQDKRNINETQIKTQAIEDDNAKILAKIRQNKMESEKEKKAIEMRRALEEAREKNRNELIERENECEDTMNREIEEQKKKLEKMRDKMNKKLSESESELDKQTERGMVLQRDLPVVKEDDDTEGEMEVDDDRRKKKRE